MPKRSAYVVLMGGALVALCLPIACNAVLGIDEATLRDSQGAAGSGSSMAAGGGAAITGPYTTGDICTNPVTACSTCIASNCDKSSDFMAINACLTSPDCRTKLDGYAACLSTKCDANGGDCFESLFSTDTTTPVPSCIEKCADACATSPVYSQCQLYCACMGSNCNGKFDDGTFASMDDCVTQCDQLEVTSPDLVTCRRTHCEIAGVYPPPRSAHCEHATGVTFCGSQAALGTADATCHKSRNSFACLANTDCCSENCNSQRACQAK